MTSKTSRGSSSAVIAAAIFDHMVQEDEINLVTSVLWFYGIKAICLEAGSYLISILLDTTPSVASMFYLSFLTHSTFKSSSSIARLTLLSVFFSGRK